MKRKMDSVTVSTAIASVAACIAMGALVHTLMWKRAREVSLNRSRPPAESLSAPPAESAPARSSAPAAPKRVRIARTLTA